MERKSASSDVITRAYIDSLLVEMRHLDAVLPDTRAEYFGKTFKTPVMTGALSHLHQWVRENGMVDMARGAAQAGALVWYGMGPDEELDALIGTGASVVKIIKPYADRELLYSRLRHAEEAGALAVGIDIDHAFSSKGGYDNVLGYPMMPMTTPELCDIVKSTKLPFVIKGVLSRQDAERCLAAGVKGLVLSHHNGRLDCAVPPLMLLPEILDTVKGKASVFVDCSFKTGLDVFKALALGADGVSVGRPLIDRLRDGGAEGVRQGVEDITRELSYAMAMTASPDIKSIDPGVVRLANFTW